MVWSLPYVEVLFTKKYFILFKTYLNIYNCIHVYFKYAFLNLTKFVIVYFKIYSLNILYKRAVEKFYTVQLFSRKPTLQFHITSTNFSYFRLQQQNNQKALTKQINSKH